METTRQQKISRQIQKDISDIFIKEGAAIVKGAMVSVTKVRISPDLSFTKIYISVFPFDRSQAMLASIEENSSQIRKWLGNRTRNQLRIIPEISFAIDDSLEYIDHIDKLLR